MTKFCVALLAITMDVASGMIIALFNRKLSSSKMRKGLLNKIGEIAAMLFGMAVDKWSPLFGVNFGYDITTAVMLYIVTMESISIIENIIIMNPTLKGLLKKEDEK